MKILVINFEYPPLGGGGGVATKDIAEELARRHEVHVVTTAFQGLARQERLGEVHIHRVPVVGRRSLPTASVASLVTFVPAALWRGWQLCRTHGFDVINAQFVVPSGIVGAVLSRWFVIPFVLSFIGGDLYDPTKELSPHRHAWLRWVVRWVTSHATLGTAISADTRRRAIDIHGVNREIVVTHLGVRQPRELSIERAAVDLPDEGFVFVSIGRLIPRKGYPVLLRALRDVPGARVVVMGEGPQRGDLLRLARELGVAERVQIRGYVDDETKERLLSAADAYVSAAEHEGFGIVFLEAMARGLPIVATDNGGQRDFLDDGENALIVASGDSDGLAAAMRRLVSEGELRERMAGANRVKVEDFFLDKTAARFEEVLRRAVDQHAR